MSVHTYFDSKTCSSVQSSNNSVISYTSSEENRDDSGNAMLLHVLDKSTRTSAYCFYDHFDRIFVVVGVTWNGSQNPFQFLFKHKTPCIELLSSIFQGSSTIISMYTHANLSSERSLISFEMLESNDRNLLFHFRSQENAVCLKSTLVKGMSILRHAKSYWDFDNGAY